MSDGITRREGTTFIGIGPQFDAQFRKAIADRKLGIRNNRSDPDLADCADKTGLALPLHTADPLPDSKSTQTPRSEHQQPKSGRTSDEQ